MQSPPPQTPREIYDSLWNASLPSLQAGQVRVDPFLHDRAEDPRRGATLIFRPAAEVIQRLSSFLDDIRQIEPGQHFYAPDELHVTILAVISITGDSATAKPDPSACAEALVTALASMPKFTVEFHGITAATDAVMIQGFPADSTLALLRQKVRETLRACGLGGELDRRYVRQASHLTVMRFREPLRNPAALCQLLQCHRQTVFGTGEVNEIDLVENDWYMSSAKVRLLQRYPLR